MGDEGDVLRFRSREGLDSPDEYDRGPGPRYESYDGYESYDRYGERGHTGLGDLTQVILVGDQVLDVVRRTLVALRDNSLALRAGKPPGHGDATPGCA